MAGEDIFILSTWKGTTNWYNLGGNWHEKTVEDMDLDSSIVGAMAGSLIGEATKMQPHGYQRVYHRNRACLY